jgi:hypothetical protein
MTNNSTLKVINRKRFNIGDRIYEQLELDVESIYAFNDADVFRTAIENDAVLEQHDKDYLRNRHFGWWDIVTGNNLDNGIYVNQAYLVIHISESEDAEHERDMGPKYWTKHGYLLLCWISDDRVWMILNNNTRSYNRHQSFCPRWLLRRVKE